MYHKDGLYISPSKERTGFPWAPTPTRVGIANRHRQDWAVLSLRVCFQISPDPPSSSHLPISLRIRKAARKCKVMRWTCWTPIMLGCSLGQCGLIQDGSEANTCYGDGGRPGSRRCIDKAWRLFHNRKLTCNACVDLAFAGVGRSCRCLPHPAHGVRLRDLAPRLIATG